jgi:hypothetical protein
MVRIISELLVVIFVALGGMEILVTLEAITWGLFDPRWSFRLLIGLIAIVGGLILFVPRCAPLGAAGLATMMAGNALRDLTQQHPSKAVWPTLLTLLLIVIGYARRPAWLWSRGEQGDC